MAPSITFSDAYEGVTYQGGAKVLHDLRWVVADIVPAEIERRVARGEKMPGSERPLDVNAALTELPLASHPFIRKYAAFYLDWLAHPTADAYWVPASPNAGYDQITVPALNISGWYDIFLWSTFQNFLGMRERGGTDHGIPVVVMEGVRGGRLASLKEKAEALLKEARPNDSIASWAFRFLQSLPNVQMECCPFEAERVFPVWWAGS